MVKEGYKLTEVGIIPMDWEVKKISDISNPVRGGSPRPAGDPRYFNGNFIPWLTVASLTNVPDSQLYVTKTAGGLTKQGANYSRKLEIDTPIIANSGFSLGIAKILKIQSCANDGIAALLDFDTNTNKVFVTYYLNTLTKRLREVTAMGNDQPNLNKERIGNIPIPLPPTIEEQTAIATALTEADALISGIEKLIAKKRDIKQGVMQKLLSPTEGWEVKKLGEICISISSGKSNTNTNNGNYPIYGSTGIIGWKNTFDYEGTKILVARVGANAGTVNRVFDKYCVSDNTLIITLKPNVDIDFIFFKLTAFQLNSLVFGSGQPLITGGHLKNIEIGLPKFEEQIRIATILSDMDAEIAVLEKKLEKYRAVKAGMMQNLLTGKIRLV